MLESAHAQIANTPLFCTNFPEKLDDEIFRTHILHTVDQVFSTDTQIAVVWGPEGIGKTTLLAQFARSRDERTVSIFLRSNTRFGYEPEHVLLDLTLQMAWLTTKKFEQMEAFDDARLSKYIYDLQRRATRENHKYIIVVDGIDDIPKDDEIAREAILSRLPLGYPQFRFIFSSSKSHISDSRFAKLRQSPIPLSPLADYEARRYIGSQVSDSFFAELYSVTKGIPGDLASYKRMLNAGRSEEELTKDLPRTLTEKYEVEWKSVDGTNDLQIKVLALIALDRTTHTLADLEFFLGVHSNEIKAAVSHLNFLDIGSSSTSELRYVSEAFRRFAASKLKEWKKTVNSMLIDALLGDPTSMRAMYHLPSYLQDTQQHERLLAYLSPDHFANMLAQSQSVRPLRQQAELGLETALRLKKDGDLVRFAVQESSILDLDAFGVSHAEIDARVAIGDDDAAVALASSAVLKQDRLRLLAALCRAKKQNGRSVEEELLDQIKTLLNEVDIRELGDKAMDLAVDLMLFLPEKAINVVERMAKSPDGKSLDVALARLSMLGIASREKQASELKKNCDDVRTRIKDPDLRNLLVAISGVLGQRSGEEILAEARKLTNQKDQIFLLRQWAALSPDHSGAASVVKYALVLAIKTTEYTPNATHCRELATPIPHIPDTDTVAELIGVFDAQKVNTERLGPTEDYVWLQLTLAEAEHRLSLPHMAERVVETYIYVSDIPDLVVKTACLARLLSTLDSVDPEQTLEIKDRLHSIVRRDFDASITRLLSETADHFKVVRSVLKALAWSRPQHALLVAELLNTEPRRDEAYAAIVNAQLALPINDVDFDVVEKALARIVDTEEREETLGDVIRRISAAHSSLGSEERIERILPILGQSSTITDSVLRTRTLGYAVSLMRRLSTPDRVGLAVHFQRMFSSSWQNIDDDWLKVELGFEMGSILADCDRTFAIECVAEANSHRKKLVLFEGSSTYILCVRLAIRAFSGLLENSVNTEEDLFRLEQLISQVPSYRKQARLWGELALRCFGCDRQLQGQKIVNDKIRPLILRLEEQNRAEWARIVCLLAPAFYSSHPISGLELIGRLPPEWIDVAYDEIINFILRKVPGVDPYDATNERYQLKYEQVVDICSVLKLINTDWIVYSHIETLVDSLLWKENKISISTQHKADIESRLNEITEKKFQNPRFIQHQGYKIISRAQIQRLKKSHEESAELLDAARAIPNLADRSMVLGILVNCFSHLDLSARKSLASEAKVVNDGIPFLFDRIDGLRVLAATCKSTDHTFSRQCLKDAFDLVRFDGDPESENLCRRIVDAAHSLSEEWASSLIASADIDPARARARQVAEKQLQELTLRDELVDESKSAAQIFEQARDRISDISWRALAGLNSGRKQPVPVSHTREYMQLAARMPIGSAYSTISWVIENANRKLKGTPHARSIIRGMFDAAWNSAELTSKLVLLTETSNVKKSISFATFNADNSIIKAGERSRAIEQIKTWMLDNAPKYLKICDPYIGPEEAAQILQIVLAQVPKCMVSILTSRKQQPKCSQGETLEDIYKAHWRKSYDQAPPDCQIVVAGLRSSGEPPIHDRWWITETAGLRFGTSFGDIGLGKDSEICRMSSSETAEREQRVNGYLYATIREQKGERITYSAFTL
jgi:hypothetical protein